MKTNNEHKEKPFDTVKTFRQIKEKIASELSGMTFEQIKAFLRASSLKLQNL
jgi:hypothetical protein